MKVLLVNGSPHEFGCTYTALREAADALESQGIEAEIIHLGIKPIDSCRGCGLCHKNSLGVCVFDNDCINDIIEAAADADGFIFGTPVHYAAASGAITAALGRCFYAGASNFAYKPGAAVVSCRRGGASAAFDQINKFFTINNMPIVSSVYWNQVHGNTPDEVKQDLEGMHTMKVLGLNMAWMLKCIDAGKNAGIEQPANLGKVRTNFIR